MVPCKLAILDCEPVWALYDSVQILEKIALRATALQVPGAAKRLCHVYM